MWLYVCCKQVFWLCQQLRWSRAYTALRIHTVISFLCLMSWSSGLSAISVRHKVPQDSLEIMIVRSLMISKVKPWSNSIVRRVPVLNKIITKFKMKTRIVIVRQSLRIRISIWSAVRLMRCIMNDAAMKLFSSLLRTLMVSLKVQWPIFEIN